MRIKSIGRVGTRTDRLELVFDDGSKLKVMATVVPDCGLHAGLDVDEEKLAEIRTVQARASAKARAVRIVTASNVSEKELKRRLVQKGEDPELAGEAVEWLSQLGAVDDAKTAAEIVRRCAAKGYGAARIRQELYHKGVPKAYWEAALAELPDMDGAIDKFLKQKLRGTTPDQRELKRVTDALLRRGHRWSEIRAALKRYEAALEEALEGSEWPE